MSRTLSIGDKGPRAVMNCALGPIYLGRNPRLTARVWLDARFGRKMGESTRLLMLSSCGHYTNWGFGSLPAQPELPFLCEPPKIGILPTLYLSSSQSMTFTMTTPSSVAPHRRRSAVKISLGHESPIKRRGDISRSYTPCSTSDSVTCIYIRLCARSATKSTSPTRSEPTDTLQSRRRSSL